MGEAGAVRARIHLNHCLQSAMRPTEPMHQVSDYYKDIWYVFADTIMMFTELTLLSHFFRLGYLLVL